MSAFPHIIDVGLTGGSPQFNAEALRQTFHLTQPRERTVLLTFGGLGLTAIPYQTLAKFPDWQFITFDRHAPDLTNLIKINDPQYRPVDFMSLCDRVVSKPGFSTFAEACRLNVPIASLTRSGFAEADLLLEGIQTHAHHQILSPELFFAGDWQFLNKPLLPPRSRQGGGAISRQGDGAISNQLLQLDGNETIAQAVVAYLRSGAD